MEFQLIIFSIKMKRINNCHNYKIICICCYSTTSTLSDYSVVKLIVVVFRFSQHLVKVSKRMWSDGLTK